MLVKGPADFLSLVSTSLSHPVCLCATLSDDPCQYSCFVQILCAWLCSPKGLLAPALLISLSSCSPGTLQFSPFLHDLPA